MAGMDGFGFDAHTGNGSSSETPVVNVSAGLGGSVGQTTPINIPFGSSAAMRSTPITTFVGSSATMGSAPVTSVIGPTAATAAMVTPLGPNMASAIPVIPSLGPNTGVFTSAAVGHPTVMLPANSVKEPAKFTAWDEFRSYLKLKRKEMTLEQLLVRLRIREEGLTREKKVAVSKANVVEHPSKEGSSKGPKPNKDKKKIGPKGGVAKPKFAGKCYNCGITGHRSSECRKKPQKKKQKKEEALCSELDAMDLCAVVTEVNLVGSNPKEWWVDTGATRHICSNRAMLFDFKETSGDKPLTTAPVTMAEKSPSDKSPSPVSTPHLAFTTISNVKLHVRILLSFTEPNYKKWSRLFLLLVRRFSLSDFLTGKSPPSNAEDTDWYQLDALLQGWIPSIINDEVSDLVLSSTDSASELWRSLHSLFHDNKPARAMQLEHQFRTTKKGSLSISAYCQTLKNIADWLDDVNAPVSEQQLVLQVLRGLPDDMQNQTTFLQFQTPPPTFLQTRPALLLLERQRSDLDDAESPSGTALFSAGHTSAIPHSPAGGGRGS
ncbi:unnamed protein product [Cuscuta campestris]|uniref:CCHC-type domain-containing protein n=1 Tax=Cuscuta campestris TaxID=132261 RepID=A0A484MM53_9ASTE|nr:unnamed protein product [Cuscuta campestris]